MKDFRDFVHDWWILLTVSGLLLVVFSPPFIENIINAIVKQDVASPLTIKALYIVNPAGKNIGWWQITYRPRMHPGDTADVEVAYIANRDVLPKPPASPAAPSTETERDDVCQRENERRRRWNIAELPCGNGSTQIPASDPAQSVLNPESFSKSVSVTVTYSDLGFEPKPDRHEFDIETIFNSPAHER